MLDVLSNNSSSLIVPRAFCRVHLPRITRFCHTPPLVQFCRYTARSTVSREHRLGSCDSQEMSITVARKIKCKELRGLRRTQIYATCRNRLQSVFFSFEILECSKYKAKTRFPLLSRLINERENVVQSFSFHIKYYR